MSKKNTAEKKREGEGEEEHVDEKKDLCKKEKK